MENINSVWEFVGAYYPNYTSSDEISENDDLQKVVDGQLEEGEAAFDIYNEIENELIQILGFEPEEYQILEAAQKRLNESNAVVFEKAIEGYIEQQNELRFNTVLNIAKAEILEDIKTKLVPRTVANFSELQDYVDANCYGGFCEDGYQESQGYDFENRIQSALDEWLKSGRQ